jgi:hypothetical protein
MGILRRLRAARAELHPGPYTIDVQENIGTTGAGVFNGERYRVVITDANGAPVKVMYSLTYKTAYMIASNYVGKLEKAADAA